MADRRQYKQKYINIKEILSNPTDYINFTVTVCGYVKTCRHNKNLLFVELSDGSNQKRLQVIFNKKDLSPDKKSYFDIVFDKVNTGTSLEVTGKIIKSPAPQQPVELSASTYIIHGTVNDPSYPISKTALTLEHLRQYPHLRPRTDTFMAIMRIKSKLRYAMAEYFESIDFSEVQIPLITDNECESGACPFTVTTLLDPNPNNIPIKDNKVDFEKDFFRKHCYLTVSGQLHLEALVCGGLNKAWCMTTAFRAEPSTGPRHLGEFWMAELEFCFSTLEDNMRVNEGCIKHCLNKILKSCYDDLLFLQEKYKPNLIDTIRKYAFYPFTVSSHEECVRLMLLDEADQKVKFEVSPKYDDDLTKEHERYITEKLFDNNPVFVRHFPAIIKSFYMPIIDKGSEVEHVDGFDLIFPEIGEVVGGSQRETDYDLMLEKMKSKNINPESLQFYLDLRKYGTVPHGGSGIGFDRLMMICTGILNIRDMVPFPRAYETCLY